MARFETPAWRLVGSVASWVTFVFFFLGLYQSAAVVMGLGGFCASGGAYVIETECPPAVLVFAPLGVFGMFLAAGIALLVARGFGVSLVSWAWSILFVGLGIQFLLTAVAGIGVVGNILVGVLFVVMGVVPVWYFVSGKALGQTLVGSRALMGERFAHGGRPRRYFGVAPVEGAAEIVPRPRDWALSLGVWAPSVAGGAWLSITAFNAVAASG